jgi:hypothetical protein
MSGWGGLSYFAARDVNREGDVRHVRVALTANQNRFIFVRPPQRVTKVEFGTSSDNGALAALRNKRLTVKHVGDVSQRVKT